MFCSNCGKPLGAVAHISNDLLLCEDCYSKLGMTGASSGKAPSTTVFLGQHNDSDRQTATPVAAEDSGATSAMRPEAGQRYAFPPPSQGPQQSVDALFRRMYGFASDEKVIWSRQLKQGIVHRHPTFLEVVTNLRAFVIDDALHKIVRGCSLRNTKIVITNERSDYSSTRVGYMNSGHYAGTGMGSGHTVGNLDFVENGQIQMSIYNLTDPGGIKDLIESAVTTSI